MTGEPLDLALRHVSETKNLLETLITSSESFDYPKAKLALKELQRKTRELAKLQAELQAGRRASAGNVVAISFINADVAREPLIDAAGEPSPRHNHGIDSN
jgi:hypothetical protein